LFLLPPAMALPVGAPPALLMQPVPSSSEGTLSRPGPCKQPQ
jgi:hypothetical protein